MSPLIRQLYLRPDWTQVLERVGRGRTWDRLNNGDIPNEGNWTGLCICSLVSYVRTVAHLRLLPGYFKSHCSRFATSSQPFQHPAVVTGLKGNSLLYFAKYLAPSLARMYTSVFLPWGISMVALAKGTA